MSTMIIREYYNCDAAEQAHWRDAIAKSDWRAGQKLYELLSSDTLRTKEWIGADARLYLLTEDDQLCAFCTLAAKDDVPNTDLTPWIGFVYTFPAWRGQHLFGILLAHAIEQARMDGHAAVYISTDHTGLYEKYGAVFLEDRKDLWGGNTRIYRLDFGWMQADETERNAGLPCREKAERLLEASHLLNPGPWREHSYCVARAAERIANACGDIDPEKAYLCGLLHDIGRRFGKGHLRHVYDGWQFMERLGFPGIARVCLTHSFKLQKLDDYIGNHDLTGQEEEAVRDALSACHYNDFDLLIQLCDSICGTQVMNIEERMLDVKRRYGGYYPQDKWNANLEILHRFENRAGGDIYRIAGKRPKMILFDYGGTLLREPDTDFLRSERSIFRHVTDNPHNHTPEELNAWENERFQSLQAVRDLDAELTELQLLRLKYELFGIKLDISYEEAEWIKWSEACPMVAHCRTPHIEDLLRFLNENDIRTGVISNIGWSGASLNRRIRTLLPDNHFEFILASSDYGIRKPSPVLFQVALEKAGLRHDEVWYCGDTFDKDVLGAHASGIFPVYYQSNREADNPRKQPEFTYLTINDWQELINLLS